MELKKDGDGYSLVTSSTFKTTEMKFKPGEEFDEDRADGAKVREIQTSSKTPSYQSLSGSVCTYVCYFLSLRNDTKFYRGSV